MSNLEIGKIGTPLGDIKEIKKTQLPDSKSECGKDVDFLKREDIW